MTFHTGSTVGTIHIAFVQKIQVKTQRSGPPELGGLRLVRLVVWWACSQNTIRTPNGRKLLCSYHSHIISPFFFFTLLAEKRAETKCLTDKCVTKCHMIIGA